MNNLSIIIPCYNEEESIPVLIEKLKLFENECKDLFTPHFIFVDDGSTDSTFQLLESNGVKLRSAKVIKHHTNKNLGAAVKTGIKEAPDDHFCAFLDSDCTYEPNVLIKLFEALSNSYDIATVSPYHPEGQVEGVPAWRLALSKGLSFVYRLILRKKIYTFTAMVRMMRPGTINQIISNKDDFSFMAESLIMALKKGLNVIEVPATLSLRKYGQSKMNVLKTIKSHLYILKKLLFKGAL